MDGVELDVLVLKES